MCFGLLGRPTAKHEKQTEQRAENWPVCSDFSANLLGSTVPTLRLDHLAPEEIRAYLIAGNKLAAGWDRDLLALEFAEVDLGFDLDRPSRVELD